MKELTDAECAAFRRLPGDFNAMVRAIYAAGVADHIGDANKMVPPSDDLIVDRVRHARFADDRGLWSGIYVRAKLGEEWGSHDIVVLTRDSLQAFLRSRGGMNEWAESVVAILLGHAS